MEVRQARIPWSFLGVIGIAAVLFMAGLGSARLWDRDEPRNAECAREMLERGDWVVPTFNGELRTHKPVLLYWLQQCSYRVWGVNAWGARFPGACCGILSVIAAMLIASRFFGERVGIWTGLVLASSLMFMVASRAATPDAPLIAASTWCVCLFVRAAYRPSTGMPSKGARSQVGNECFAPEFKQPSAADWIGVYVACGAAVLAKGIVGLVLPMSVIAGQLFWQTYPAMASSIEGTRATRWWHWLRVSFVHACRTVIGLRPFLGLATVLFIAGPWYLAVGMATDGVWLREFFWTHHVSRATHAMEGHHGPPVLYYVAALAAGTFPWSIWFIPFAVALRDQWHHVSLRPGMMLGGLWILVYIACFSCAATKLPSYITPCYPGAAMLMGCVLAHWSSRESQSTGWMRAGLWFGALAGIVMAIGLGMLQIGDRLPLLTLAPIAMVFAIIAMAAARLAQQHQPARALKLYAVGALGLMATMMGYGPASIDRQRGDLRLLEQALLVPNTKLAVIGEVEPSWIFYSQARVTQLPIEQWQDHALRFLSQGRDRVLLASTDRIPELNERLESFSLPIRLDILPRGGTDLNGEMFTLIRIYDQPMELAKRLDLNERYH